MKRIAILGLLLLSLFALNVTLPATSTAEAYECKPAGTWYCQQSSQCAGLGRAARALPRTASLAAAGAPPLPDPAGPVPHSGSGRTQPLGCLHPSLLIGGSQ